MALSIGEVPIWFFPLLVWTLYWKATAMWRAARNNQVFWFIISLVVNTFGFLPMMYLIWFQRDMNGVRGKVSRKKVSKKKKVKKAPTL